MVRQRLLLFGLPVAGALSAGVLFVLTRQFALVEPERWFSPREAGHEGGYRMADWTGRSVWPDHGQIRREGFLTRVLGVEAEWGRHNQLTDSLAFSHNLGNVFPPDLARQHPEFFPLADGHRLQPPAGGAFFWNPDLGRPDVAHHAAEAARRYFAAHPAATSFSLGVNDALIWGESPELLALIRPGAWFRERPDYSNLVCTFMNRAAAELSRTHPEKYLGALAYYWAENAPDFPLHPQVIPFLTADRAQGYDPGFQAEEFRLQERWAERAGQPAAAPVSFAGRGAPSSSPGPQSRGPATASPIPADRPCRLGMYDYLYGSGFLIPRLHPKLLGENLRHARRAGFTDYYAEMNPNWGLDGPMPWLTAQLLQDPEQPETALLDEYYRRYFGEAAEPMRRFFARCEELWMKQPGPPYWLKHYRNESQAVIFPLPACRELRAQLEDAAWLATQEKTRQRVRFVGAAFGVTERFVSFQDARDRLARLALAASPDSRAITSALETYLGRRRELVRYTTTLRREQPLALAPFDWSDYLKNDPAAAALLALYTTDRERRVWPSGGAPTASAGPAGTRDPITSGQSPITSRSNRAGLDAEIARWNNPPVTTLWSALGARPAGPGRELLRDPRMEGPAKPARTIAGLEYGVALPVDWFSQVEPAQFHRAGLLGPAGARILRISGSKDTTVSQWDPVGGTGLHGARIAVRGRVSPGTAVSLVFAWLDGNGRHVGFKTMRLPDGDWPGWVALHQAGTPPAGAVWAGLGLRVQNQVRGDWIEAGEFSLRYFWPSN